MNFLTEQLKCTIFHPDQELFQTTYSNSKMKTPTKVRSVFGELKFPKAPDQRPYIYGCMVLSFDGKMSFSDEPEGTLISKNNFFDPKGAALDFWVMNVCRCYADAVILGCGTLHVRKNKMWYAQISDDDLIVARSEMGKKTREPLSIITSLDGTDIPFEHTIFRMNPAPLIMTSHSGADLIKKTMSRSVRVIDRPENLLCESEKIRVIVAGEEKADTVSLLRLLRLCGIEYVSVEAPGYVWFLLESKVLDEYFLNYSGVFAGGKMALGALNPFTSNRHPHQSLLTLGYTKGFIFTRQKILY